MIRDIYEYTEHNNTRAWEDRLELFNRYGKEGWELVLVRGGNNYIFKRKIVENEES